MKKLITSQPVRLFACLLGLFATVGLSGCDDEVEVETPSGEEVEIEED